MLAARHEETPVSQPGFEGVQCAVCLADLDSHHLFGSRADTVTEPMSGTVLIGTTVPT